MSSCERAEASGIGRSIFIPQPEEEEEEPEQIPRLRGWAGGGGSGSLDRAAVMGSRLSRHNSLDQHSFTQKRRRLDGTAEGGGGTGGDFLFTLMLKSDKLPGMLRRTNHSPYVRRVAWIKEIQKLLRDRRMEQASDVLRLLRKVSARARAQQQMDACVLKTQQRPRIRIIISSQTFVLGIETANRWVRNFEA